MFGLGGICTRLEQTPLLPLLLQSIVHKGFIFESLWYCGASLVVLTSYYINHSHEATLLRYVETTHILMYVEELLEIP